MNSKEATVPDKVATSFETFIKDYVGYCNNRNYVAAWNLVSKECKDNFFGNDYDLFVDYVKQKFNGNTKRYAIQDYSNVNGKYIYNVKIFNDFLATGLTNQSFVFQEEKMLVSYDEDKNIVVSVGNYMGSQDLNYMASNDYMIVKVTESIEKYSYIVYKLEFINRSNYTIVVKDNMTGDMEVGMAIGNETRATSDDAVKIVLEPGKSQTVMLSFAKFYDSNTKPKGIILNSVRVMENYTGDPENVQAEIDNAVDKFGMTVGF